MEEFKIPQLDDSVNIPIPGENVLGAPQPALTPATGGTLTSGSSSDPMVDTDSVILTNALTRIAEIEAVLRKLGFIK